MSTKLRNRGNRESADIEKALSKMLRGGQARSPKITRKLNMNGKPVRESAAPMARWRNRKGKTERKKIKRNSTSASGTM